MNTTIIILGIIRGILIALVLRYVGAYIDSIKPKNKTLKYFWRDEQGFRKWLIAHAWEMGALVFLGHFFYAVAFITN